RPLSQTTASYGLSSLSLHDALPIWRTRGHRTAAAGAEKAVDGAVTPVLAGRRITLVRLLLGGCLSARNGQERQRRGACERGTKRDRKSTRLNSSHVKISYAVFCLKK